MTFELILLTVFVSINLIAFIMMGMDKSYARQGHYRISEDMLITMALIGGSIGLLIGMIRFRHKTKKPKFAYGIPLILLIQFALFAVYGYPILMK